MFDFALLVCSNCFLLHTLISVPETLYNSFKWGGVWVNRILSELCQYQSFTISKYYFRVLSTKVVSPSLLFLSLLSDPEVWV